MDVSTLKGTARRYIERRWTRKNQIILAVVATLALLVGVGLLLTRYVVRRGWPQVQGELALAGLEAPVTVVRDRYGVPHIYAQSASDLFFVQGYVHAQDRFWGMEINRRHGRGTLAEILGDEAQATDEAWLALDLAEVARRELDVMDAAARVSLDAYAAGVNAWLERHRLPFEYNVLKWRGRGPEDPAPWTPEDSLIVALVSSWQVGGPRVDPNVSSRLNDRVGLERAAFLLGEAPGPATRSGPGDVKGFFAGLSFRGSTDVALTESSAPLPQRWVLGGRVTLVSGDRTESGAPLLAVDLPTGLDLPAPWYLLAWRVGADAAAGASVPGVPGLVTGIDDRGVWQTWPNPRYIVLSLLKELVPGGVTPPWGRWMLEALLNDGQILQLDDDRAPAMRDGLWARQSDTYSAQAERLIRFLLDQVEPAGWRQERVTGMLRKWDYRVGDNNKEAPFFAVYQLELARAAFADELGDDLFEAFAAQSDLYQIALHQIVQDPDDEWWDDVNTPERELRSDILKRAYEPALEWIGRNYGDLHMLWEWDIVHGSRLHHALGDVWPWDQLFSRDFEPDGWADTNNASPGGLLCLGGICQGGDFFRAKAVYGYRQILDASDPTTLWFALLPGQSGHPFHPHYDDLMDEWLAGDYVPLHLAASPEEVDGAESVLILRPED